MSSVQRSLGFYVPITSEPNEPRRPEVNLGPDVVGERWGKGSSFEFSAPSLVIPNHDEGLRIIKRQAGEPLPKRKEWLDVECEIERDEKTITVGDVSIISLVPTDIYWTTKFLEPKLFFDQEPRMRIYDYLFWKVSTDNPGSDQ